MELSKLNFVGTVEEFAAVEHLFGAGHRENVELVQERNGSSDGEGKGRDGIIRDVIRRRPVPSGQRELYEVLDKAGDSGLLKLELAEAMSRTEREFTGVLGALGKRIFGTKGTGEQGISLFLEISAADNTWRYRLRPEVRTVLKAEGLL